MSNRETHKTDFRRGNRAHVPECVLSVLLRTLNTVVATQLTITKISCHQNNLAKAVMNKTNYLPLVNVHSLVMNE